MNKYEAMFIVKPELKEEEQNILFKQIQELITKNGGTINSAEVWSSKRKLGYRIKGCNEGTYYLLLLSIAPSAIVTLKQSYLLNENILRLLILRKPK